MLTFDRIKLGLIFSTVAQCQVEHVANMLVVAVIFVLNAFSAIVIASFIAVLTCSVAMSNGAR
jgi:hypothetical protein